MILFTLARAKPKLSLCVVRVGALAAVASQEACVEAFLSEQGADFGLAIGGVQAIERRLRFRGP